MTIAEARAEGTETLHAAGLDTPGLDAALLLAEVLAVDRTQLLTRPSDPLTGMDAERYRRLVARRRAGECVAYILGRKEFRGLDFLVNDAVLVPRPDTETLVEAALAWIDTHPESGRVLDVCTGSGCVAIAIKHERPRCQVAAGDLSPAALAVAADNVARLLPAATLNLYLSDLLHDVPGSWGLIVANPPYVPSAVIDGLAAEVRGEPRLALDGGSDGLGIIRRLITESVPALTAGGGLLIEAGSEQAESVAALLAEAGFVAIQQYRDLAGHYRVTGGTLPERA